MRFLKCFHVDTQFKEAWPAQQAMESQSPQKRPEHPDFQHSSMLRRLLFAVLFIHSQDSFLLNPISPLPFTNAQYPHVISSPSGTVRRSAAL